MKGLLFFCAVSIFAATSSSDETLKLVHVFFRHGSRTPELKHTYPTDPYESETDVYFPMGYGALTNKGKQMSFKLGEILRRRYNMFLGNLYIPGIVRPISTDYDRTKVTLLLVLAGLFPPPPSQSWSEFIPWLPIPIHYDKDKYDYTLRRPNNYCPEYVKALEEFLSSEAVQKEIKNDTEIFKYVQKNTELPINTHEDIFGVYQTLNAEAMMNLTLPKWTKSVYPQKLHSLAAKQCYFENANTNLTRLNGGRMLGKVINQMVAKSTDSLHPTSRKIYLYSGHENNVINILAALDLFKPHVPKFTASVIIELYYMKDSNTHAVKVLYLKDVDEEPEVLQLEKCDILCPLNKFIELTEHNVPVNYTAECHSNVNLD